MKTEITTDTMFKWLKPNRMTTFQNAKWPVPVGVWTPGISNPKPCVRGWHLSTYDGIGCFTGDNYELWVAKGRGASVSDDGTKTAFESVKLVERVGVFDRKTAVNWAIWCATHVLHLYEDKYPGDDRPRKAINAASAWLANPSDQNARAAAYAARDAAASDAAAYAARAAAASDTADAAAYAARAARAAAYAARAAAASDAARAAAAAAYAADAARAAAASDAARAAYAAAYAADAADERRWQSGILFDIMKGQST